MRKSYEIIPSIPPSPTMNRSLRLCQELLSPSSQQEGGRGRRLTLLEHVISLTAHLHLLKYTARAQHILLNAVYCGLDLGACRLLDSLDVVIGNTASTENTTVGEVLSSEIADRKAGEDDIGSQTHALGQLFVDEGPFGIYDGLVLLGVNSNLELRKRYQVEIVIFIILAIL